MNEFQGEIPELPNLHTIQFWFRSGRSLIVNFDRSPEAQQEAMEMSNNHFFCILSIDGRNMTVNNAEVEYFESYPLIAVKVQ